MNEIISLVCATASAALIVAALTIPGMQANLVRAAGALIFASVVLDLATVTRRYWRATRRDQE